MGVYGYIRVSSTDQNEDRQMIALRGVPVPLNRIYMDKQSDKDLMGTFIADMVLQILSFVAQSERENIRKRQRQGIDAARQRGVQFGRPKKPLPENFDEVRLRWERGEITAKAAARECSLSMTTFRRRAEMAKKTRPRPDRGSVARKCTFRSAHKFRRNKDNLLTVFEKKSLFY